MAKIATFLPNIGLRLLVGRISRLNEFQTILNSRLQEIGRNCFAYVNQSGGRRIELHIVDHMSQNNALNGISL
jgi:hypothetical protein